MNSNQVPYNYPITPIGEAYTSPTSIYQPNTSVGSFMPEDFNYGMPEIFNLNTTTSSYDGIGKNTVAGLYKDGQQIKESVIDPAIAGVDTMSFGQKATAIGGVAKGLFDAYNGYKANKLAKEQFAFTKMNTNRNFQASANTTNAALADRQAARYARDPNQHSSVSDYMKKYGVKA